MSSETLSRRERRTASRRAHILDAAAEVFAKQGFHRTTTKDIAEAADIAEGTIYNYFQSKDDLVIGLLGRLANLEERRRVMEDALQEDFQSFVVRHFSQRLKLAQANNTLIAAVLPELLSSSALREEYTEQMIKPALEMLEQHIQARREAGQIPPVDVPVVTRLVTATVLGLTVMTLLGDDVAEFMWSEPETLAETLTKFLFGGLGAVIANPPEEQQT